MNSLEKGYKIDSIYIDFAKTINFNRYILIGECLIFGYIIKWFENYFFIEAQFVKYKKFISHEIGVSFVDLQGSNLGPL